MPLSFRGAAWRRTRNPEPRAALYSGFRVRGLRPRPGMTAGTFFSAPQLSGPNLLPTLILFLDQPARHRLAHEFGRGARHAPSAREHVEVRPPFRVVPDVAVVDLIDFSRVFRDEAVRLNEIREDVVAGSVPSDP